MKIRMLAGLLVFISATSVFAQGSEEAVKHAKATLEASGVNLSGACGAFRITNLVAWNLRPAYGFLKKRGGNRAIVREDGSCVDQNQANGPELGYATDYLINLSTFFGYDILHDGGTLNGPQWGEPETAADMVARNRDNFALAFDWGVVVAPPVPPAPPTVDLGPLTARLNAFESVLVQLRDALSAVTARVEALEQDHGDEVSDLLRRVITLENRPTVSSCSAAANFGAFHIPISCKVQ